MWFPMYVDYLQDAYDTQKGEGERNSMMLGFLIPPEEAKYLF